MTDFKRRRLLGNLAAIVALALTTSLVGAEKPRAKNHSVDITARGFQPSRVTIRAGDSVTWSNDDARDHTVTASKGVFASGNIKSGGRFSFRFSKAGTYPYACSLHPRMKGSVIVQP